jgi:hypothetical protein
MWDLTVAQAPEGRGVPARGIKVQLRLTPYPSGTFEPLPSTWEGAICGVSWPESVFLGKYVHVNRHFPYDVVVHLPLDVATVDRIEEARGNGPLNYTFKVDFAWRRVDIAGHPPTAAETMDVNQLRTLSVSGIQRMQLTEPGSIDRDAWAKILSDAGFDSFDLVEIPVGRLNEHELVRIALSRLQTAIAHLRRQHWNEAVGTAYKAIEDAAAAAAPHESERTKQWIALRALMLRGITGTPRDEGLKRILQGLGDFRNEGFHGGGNDAGPAEAELLVTMATAVIRYMSRALPSP